jgi:succinate dehydrogenase / fumarate reductase cytochrome b subunit
MTLKSTSPVSERPLSPHLQVYTPQLTSMLSIAHRITGVALAVGTALLVFWLCSAAYSPECFTCISGFFGSILGKFMLFGWSFAFYFHLCNGIRHLFWDIGKGFEIPAAYRSGHIVIVTSILLTGITWIAYLAQGNGQ